LGGPGGAVGGKGGAGRLLKGALAIGGGVVVGANVGSFINEEFQGVKQARNFETGQVNAILASKDATRIEKAIAIIEDQLNPDDFGASVALALDVNGVRSTLEGQKADLEQQLVEMGLSRQQAQEMIAKQEQLRVQSSAFASSASGAWSRQQRAAYAQLTKMDTVASRTGEVVGRLGTSNSQLGVIARKNFSPKVTVHTTVNTNVAISDVIRHSVSRQVASGGEVFSDVGPGI
jgi:hypothetical protein